MDYMVVFRILKCVTKLEKFAVYPFILLQCKIFILLLFAILKNDLLRENLILVDKTLLTRTSDHHLLL